jgi:hypothetical protein
MTDEEKNNLVIYVLTDKIKKSNPEKYGNLTTPEEWQDVLENDKAAVDAAGKELETMTDEDWENYEAQYEASMNTPAYRKGGILSAAKGAKLKKLRSLEKPKKCKCGCNMVDIKEKGGKITSVCSCRCGGKVSKKEKGGLLKEAKEKLLKTKLIKKNQDGAKINKANPATKNKGTFKQSIDAELKADSAAYAKAYPKSDIARQFNKDNPPKKLVKKECGGKLKNRIAKAKLANKK